MFSLSPFLSCQESWTRDPQCDSAQPMTNSMGQPGVFILAECLLEKGCTVKQQKWSKDQLQSG